MATVGGAVHSFNSPNRVSSNLRQPASQAMEKIRRCPHCSREFQKNDHYERHLRSHTNEKPFGCKICGKFYPRRDTLLRHIKTHKTRHHSPGRPPVNSRGNTSQSHRGDSQAAMADDRSMMLGAAASLDSDFDLEEATLDLTVTGDGRVSALLSGPSTSARPNSDVFSGDQDMDEDQSMTDNLAVYFDPSNWLLDENLVDFGLGDTWNESRNTDDSSSLRPQLFPMADRANQPPTVLDLRQIWYNQTRRTIDSLHDDYEGDRRSNAATLRSDIDETYRTHMVEELCTPPRNEPLPSLDFLNLCIQLFFTQFNVALPIVHGPTFRPSENNILSVLTMCCAGATTMTSGMASRVGSMLFERTHKAGNGGPWERGLSERPHLTPHNITGAIIGQTFALLSSDPAHRAIADAYHGCLLSLGRHVGLFDEIPDLNFGMASAEDLEERWKRWARNEEMRRAAIVLHIHDAELAALFHHEPAFRHYSSRLPDVAPNSLFQAPTAAIWARKYNNYVKNRHSLVQARLNKTRFGAQSAKDREQNLSLMNAWAVLSGIGATICEYRSLKMLSPQRITDLEADLVAWYTFRNCCKTEPCRTIQEPELPFCLRPLWHYTFITLNADMGLLEVAVGRDGTDILASRLDLVRAWISSPESKRCLLHALLLQNLVRSTTVDSAIAIYTPRILFSAALCWHCFTLYLPWCAASSDSGASLLLDDASEYLMALPEIQLLKEDRSTTGTILIDQSISDLKRIMGANPAGTKASTLCVLESTLRRLGTTGISQRFADLIQAFITGGIQ